MAAGNQVAVSPSLFCEFDRPSTAKRLAGSLASAIRFAWESCCAPVRQASASATTWSICTSVEVVLPRTKWMVAPVYGETRVPREHLAGARLRDRGQVAGEDVVAGVAAVSIDVKPGRAELRGAGVPGHRRPALDRQGRQDRERVGVDRGQVDDFGGRDVHLTRDSDSDPIEAGRVDAGGLSRLGHAGDERLDHRRRSTLVRCQPASLTQHGVVLAAHDGPSRSRSRRDRCRRRWPPERIIADASAGGASLRRELLAGGRRLVEDRRSARLAGHLRSLKPADPGHQPLPADQLKTGLTTSGLVGLEPPAAPLALALLTTARLTRLGSSIWM